MKNPKIISIYAMDLKTINRYRPIGTNTDFKKYIYESTMTIDGSLSFTCDDTFDFLNRVLEMNQPTIINDTTATADYFLMDTRLLFSKKKYRSIIIHSDGNTCKIYATITDNLWIYIGKFNHSEILKFETLISNGVLDKSIIAFRDLHYYFAIGEYLNVKYKFKKIKKHLV